VLLSRARDPVYSVSEWTSILDYFASEELSARPVQ
jgi:hypothetical protein